MSCPPCPRGLCYGQVRTGLEILPTGYIFRCMSLTIFRFFAAWRPALSQFWRGFTPVETEPPPYPFAPTDVARLHRLTPPGDGSASGSLDDQTWRDLLLDRYADSLSGEVSIFGR